MKLSRSDGVELYDSDILRIENGPLAYMVARQQSSMDLEDFRSTVIGKFGDIGFRVTIRPYETSQSGVFAFDIEITGRTGTHEFDYDRMVHEVTSNLLELPGEEPGFIKTREDVKKLLDYEPGTAPKHGHGHGHGH